MRCTIPVLAYVLLSKLLLIVRYTFVFECFCWRLMDAITFLYRQLLCWPRKLMTGKIKHGAAMRPALTLGHFRGYLKGAPIASSHRLTSTLSISQCVLSSPLSIFPSEKYFWVKRYGLVERTAQISSCNAPFERRSEVSIGSVK